MYFKGQKLKSGIKYNLLHHEAGPCRVQEGLLLLCTVVNVNECGTEILTAYPTLKLVTSCSVNDLYCISHDLVVTMHMNIQL